VQRNPDGNRHKKKLNMKLNKHKWFAICLFLSFLISCQKEISYSGGAAPVTAKSIVNVSYGTDTSQKMDVYLPANRSIETTKVIVLLHGGAWSSGDKTDFSTLLYGMVIIDTLKARFPDYAIFNINYRLSTGTANLFPAQENDVKSALQFIFDKSGEYLVSNKYVIIGLSAGAHLAMLQGYKYSAPIKPKAIVSFFGPADLTDMYYNPAGGNPFISLVLAQTIGTTPMQDPLLYTNSSPATFINAASPPTILLHGDADPLVSPSQSDGVKNKLSAAGITNRYILYPGKGHGDDWGAAIYKDAFNNIQIFLTANVH
jgi:acetyl esterase/lipase